ncbi:MAG: hypothetical protein AAGI50_16090 [Pseudomonadota bacterium]
MSSHRRFRLWPCVSLVLSICLAAAAAAATPYREGASTLFIGHSFLVPVARQFDVVASATGLGRHRTELVFAPGGKGTPGRMWESVRLKNRVTGILERGDIEIFGVGGMGRTTTFEQLDNWLRLALSYNPATTFVVAQTHMPGGPRTEAERYHSRTVAAGDQLYEVVQRLRRAHPGAEIVFLNHGFVASDMSRRFAAGTLSDITQLAGRGSNTLFLDRSIGHAGRMMTYVSALVWMERLYGRSASEIGRSPFNRADVLSLVDTWRAAHARHE